MASITTPVFVIGSGRSGTRTIFKLLSGIENIEIYHEYLCTQIQQIAAMYYMKLLQKDEVKKNITLLHGAAIFYSEAEVWIDCSNKLSWIIEPLYEIFPDAKFINLVRDGRKVVSSFFHKLPDEMYDDKSTAVLRNWLNNKDKLPIPPPEKKYWWNIPPLDNPFYLEFNNFDHFQRVCFQWYEANRIIKETLINIPDKQQLTVKLEDLVNDRISLNKLLTFIGIEYNEKFYDFLKTPQNVIFPMDFKLNEIQTEQFNQICGDMMRQLGYDNLPEYKVNY